MGRDDVLELASCLFAPLLDLEDDCEDCRERGEHCFQPHGLDDKGFVQHRADGPGLAAAWPGCPARYLALRRHGLEFVSLPALLEWEAERGVHRRSRLTAGAEMLMRTYHRLREAPEVLRSRHDRAVKEAERKARGLAAGRGGR